MRAATAALQVEPRDEAPAPRPGRPRPTPAPLDERSWAEAYRKQADLTKSAMAEQIGYDRSSYSRWEEGTYDADPKPIAAAIRALRDRVEGPGGLSVVIGYRETTTFRVVARAMELAGEGQFVILIGESGAGKSEAIKEIRRRAIRAKQPMPVYIEGTVFTSGYALVLALAQEMGLERRANPDALLRAIADKLRRTPRVLVLDEAHYAHPKAIEALRQIRDMSGCGVLLAGTSTFAGLPIGKLGQSDLLQELQEHRPHLEQVTSRAIIWPVPGIAAEESEAIARDVLGPCMADAMERLLALSGESVRRLVRMIDEVRKVRAARKTSGAVSLDDIEAAWKRLYGKRR